jgi:hypothetical protein
MLATLEWLQGVGYHSNGDEDWVVSEFPSAGG